MRDEPAPLHEPPAALVARFDVPALLADPSTLALVSPSGTIGWVNLAWYRFARANGAAEVARRYGVGASYLDGISGDLRDGFREALEVCSRGRAPFELDYECSSSETERLFRLRGLPLDDGSVLLSHSLVVARTMARPDAPGIEVRYTDARGIIVQCSNCRRVRRVRSDAWDWVPEWVATPRPNVSHGLCALCVGFYYSALFR